MNLGKYIRLLLPENETVIVPGFGAFISEYKPAQIDETTGEMTPPSKRFSFTAKIKNNDGLLVGFVAQSEQIPIQEALGRIEQERDETIYKLDKGEKVILEGTGVLFYNENREIQFDPAESDNLLPDAFGLGSISAKDEPEEISLEKKEETIVSGISEDDAVLSEDETEKSEPEKEMKPFVAFNSAKMQSEVPPKKKSRIWMWLLLLLIPVIVAGIYFLRKEKKEPAEPVKITMEPPAKKEQPALVTDSVVPEPVEILAVDTIKAIEGFSDSTNYIEPDPSKFYLIGGSFNDVKNAEKYFNKMKKEGFEPFHLGKQGSFFLVGFEIHDNEIEAYGAQYNYLDKYPDSGVWVFIPE